MTPALLFSDVDGTLLSNDGRYALGPLALRRYATRVHIILASSRTLAELVAVQRDLGLSGPVVAENGALVALPAAEHPHALGERCEVDGDEWIVVRLGLPAAVLEEALMTAAERHDVSITTQLATERLGDRRCSVLFKPAPGTSEQAFERLVSALRSDGLTVASGGQWMALTGRADKGTGAQALLRHLVPEPSQAVVAAVGDADNDIPLLRAIGRGFVIRRDDGTWHPGLSALPGMARLYTRGVKGWRTALRCLAQEGAA